MNPQRLLQSTRFRHSNDPWYCHDGHDFHAYLQGIGDPVRPEDKCNESGIAHFTSHDGFRWLEMNPVLRPGAPGADDDAPLYSGCTLFHDGIYYLYYTGRRVDEDHRNERIFLTTSRDGEHFQRVSPHPIVVPDPAHYESVPHHSPNGTVNFRDPDVIYCPEDKTFYMVFAARSKEHEGVLGLAKSTDPVQGWELCPPIYRSRKTEVLECPHWMRVGGRYVICYSQTTFWLTAEGRRCLRPEDIEDGIFYVQGDHPEGTFDDADSRALIASPVLQGRPYAAAPVQVGGRTWLGYNVHNSKGCAHFKEVVMEGGRVVLKWNPNLEAFCGPAVTFTAEFSGEPGPGFRFSAPRMIGHDGLVTGRLRRGTSRQAGIFFRADEYGNRGLYVAWDFQRAAVVMGNLSHLNPKLVRALPDFAELEEFAFHLLFLEDQTEFYINDQLVLSTGPLWDDDGHSRLGAMEMGGAAEFAGLSFRPVAMSDGRRFF